jgi:hypothetical protein
MARAKTADIYSNAQCEKIHKKNSFSRGAETGEGPGQTAEEEKAPRPGRPAGRGAHGNPYRRFGPGFRGPYFFPVSGKKNGQPRNPG